MVNRTAALDGKWREGKVRPIPGNSPHDRLVSRGIFHRQGELATIPSPPLPSGATIDIILRRLSMRFPGRAESIGPMWFKTKKQSQNQIPGREPTASRWSAPSPGKRTRREEHALSHRPQMSSGRLFLDRVGRHQSPSPLRRHAQTTTHFPRGTSKPELSTLLGSGTFYFALTPHWGRVSRQSRKFRFQTSNGYCYLLAFPCHSLNGHRLASRPPVKTGPSARNPARS